MAVATLISQLTVINENPTAPTTMGTGNAPANETLLYKFGSSCSAVGHAGLLGPTTVPTAISQLRGLTFTVTSLARANTHLHLWIQDWYKIRNHNLGGICVGLGGASGCLYFVTGADKGYDGQWFHAVLNLDPTTRATPNIGAAPSANITSIGCAGNISVSAAEALLQNLRMDALRAGVNGAGITFTGGASGDKLTLLNCAAADVSAYGLWRNLSGSPVCEGPVTFGAAGANTYIKDSLTTVSFTEFSNGSGVSLVAPDFYRIIFATGGVGFVTNVELNATWKGVNRATPFKFDTSNLDSVRDLYISTQSTYLFANPVNLGLAYGGTGDSFIENGIITPLGATLLNPIFQNCDQVVLTHASDSIVGGSTVKHNTTTGISYVITDNLSKVTGHKFDNTDGSGHAIELNASTPVTLNLDATTFTGYGGIAGSNLVASTGSTDAAIYNNSGKAITISVINGATVPSVRNGAASTTTIVASSNPITVIVKDESTGALLPDARVYMEAAAGGTMTAGEVILAPELTGADGTVTTSVTATDQPFVGLVVETLSPGLYVPKPISGSIPSGGITINVGLVKDE